MSLKNSMTTLFRLQRSFVILAVVNLLAFFLWGGQGPMFNHLLFAAESGETVSSHFTHRMPTETNHKPEVISAEELAKGFLNPTSQIRTGVYWYWLSGNVSKEGVIKDLNAMKKAGIDRAQIGDIGVDGLKRGPVRTLSPQWWEIIHTALKTATQLDIEIGIFNSPGWSQSGGPWVKPENAMRYLTSSSIHVTGPKEIHQKLEQPAQEFQDVKVLACPAPKEEGQVFTNKSGTVTSLPKNDDIDVLIDGKTGSHHTDGSTVKSVTLPPKEEFSISFKATDTFIARSLTIFLQNKPIQAKARLYTKEGDQLHQIVEFEISRYNPELHVGFIPYAPVTVSFEKVTAKEYLLVLESSQAESGITEIALASSPRIAYYSEKTLAKMHQTPHPLWSEYQWPRQAVVDDMALTIDPKSVLDISDKMDKDGFLTWSVPKGDWIIFRTGMTPTGTKNTPAVPEATGCEVDKMSREHTIKHFHGLMGEILKRVPAEDRKSFKIVVQDSYEVGGQNFTDNFFKKFQAAFGYDPKPFLPAYFGYVVGSQEESDRFLWDVRRLIADEIAYSYVGGLRDISNEHGLKTWLECYGHWGFPGEFLQYGGQSDEIAGEYWSEGSLGDIENRIASSCGHIYGKKVIWSESNTCSGKPYGRSPVDMKLRTDLFFSEGINQTLLHLYVQQPEEKVPGINAWFGNEFNRHNTWFSQIDLFTLYLKRCNFMLQQGLNVADVAYFIGEDAPKMVGTVDPKLPQGYQYDFINAEVISESMFVRDGRLTLPHGTSYRVLVLPKLETMRPALLKKIIRLVHDGAVVLGNKPSRSPSLQDQPNADNEVRQLANELWGNVDGNSVKYRKVGKGIIAQEMSLEELFKMIGHVPDCRIMPNTPILFGHRHLDNADIYFLTNQSKLAVPKTAIEFRTHGKVPEIWYPTTGDRQACSYESGQEGTTRLTLSFAPQESCFVVFTEKRNADRVKIANVSDKEKVLSVVNKALVTFDSGPVARGPKDAVMFESLSDWTTNDNKAIKYYSGTARYDMNFNIDQLPSETATILLDLGSVAEMAKVRLNGKYVGGVWTAPYRLDITKFVQKGNNILEIEVVNTWSNRLIGDQLLPESERKTWCPVNDWKADSPLKPSGLLKPVTVIVKSGTVL